METKKITIAETFRFPGTDIILEKGDVVEVPVEEATPEKRCECGQLLTGEEKLCEVCTANNERNEGVDEKTEGASQPELAKELINKFIKDKKSMAPADLKKLLNMI